MIDWNERIRIAQRVAERLQREFDAAAQDYAAARELFLEARLRFHEAGEHWSYGVAYRNQTVRCARRARS
jgi:hypothetical protein